MTKGRKQLPDKIKKLKGTDQPIRMSKNKGGYDSLAELPTLRPNPLNKQGKSIYRSTGNMLINQGLLNEVNFSLFVSYCIELGTYYELIEDVKEEGYTVEEVTKSGSRTLPNPKRKMANDALDRARQLSSEFGLTPASESKISSPGRADEDPLSQLLNE